MSNFRAQLERAYKVKVEEKLDDVTRDTALILHGQLIQDTPVDTSRAKSNWWPDIDNVNIEIKEPDDGVASEAKMKEVMKSYKLGDTIYISNNLPYIRPLNDGTSVQQPEGFVERAVQVANRKAKELAKT